MSEISLPSSLLADLVRSTSLPDDRLRCSFCFFFFFFFSPILLTAYSAEPIIFPQNEDCEKGWFHLGCVVRAISPLFSSGYVEFSLTFSFHPSRLFQGAVPPTKGKWFCKDCAKGAGSAGRRRR